MAIVTIRILIAVALGAVLLSCCIGAIAALFRRRWGLVTGLGGLCLLLLVLTLAPMAYFWTSAESNVDMGRPSGFTESRDWHDGDGASDGAAMSGTTQIAKRDDATSSSVTDVPSEVPPSAPAGSPSAETAPAAPRPPAGRGTGLLVLGPLLLMLVIIGGITGMIIGIVRQRWAMAIGAGVAVVIVPVLLTFVTMPVGSGPSDFSTAPPPRVSPAAGHLANEPAWGHAIDGDPDYLADVYPTEHAAAAALGRHLAGRTALTELPEGAANLTVSLENELADEQTFRAFRDLMRRHLPGSVQLNITQPNAPPPTDLTDENAPQVAVRVQYVNLPEHEADWGLAAVVERNGERQRFTTGYVDKPWVVDLDEMPNANEWWLVLRSQTIAATPEEALQDVRAQAAAQLAPPVRHAIQTQFGGPIPPALENQLLEHIDAAIEDVFVQKFGLDYGDIYRASVLVNRSPAIATQLAQAPMHQVRQSRHQLLSIIVLVVVLFGVYGFLQVATRGYYAWAVRGLVVAMLVGGLFLVLVGWV